MSLFWLIVVGGVIYLLFKASRRDRTAPAPKGLTNKSASRSAERIPDWLRERWDLAERLGAGDVFPAWYFDPMTEFQSNRLDDDGRSHSPRLTKGQASDLIGLGEPADEDELEVLRFFKRPLRGMSESRARHEIALLFKDEAARKAWEERPMTARQKEFFRFFGMRTSAGLLKRDADQLIAVRIQRARDEGDPLFNQWSTYESLLDEFDDPDFREGYGIKKPPIAAIRNAIDALLAEGKTWDDLDSDTVAERLLEMRPNLER
ncbi:hypothetical protein [Luteimonas kalidii]|uniref:Uncharacterized protein n=1 Tax=Luteimonas kalidii TaxID=3042025 RepID=A0ABT6JUE6_9GAMM|nr:hypothetical protein [Luteimonas kalidii]MDH5834227.1 hypothetical protein [Luteimonas kalidii]